MPGTGIEVSLFCKVSTITPRGLTRKQAAIFFGLSLSGFDKARREGKIPLPTLPGKRYDMQLLQAAMNTMSGISAASTPLTDEYERWRQSRARPS